jgi:hypothetical protein
VKHLINYENIVNRFLLHWLVIQPVYLCLDVKSERGGESGLPDSNKGVTRLFPVTCFNDVKEEVIKHHLINMYILVYILLIGAMV